MVFLTIWRHEIVEISFRTTTSLKNLTARLKIQKWLATGQMLRDSIQISFTRILGNVPKRGNNRRPPYSTSQINRDLWQTVENHQLFSSVPRSHDTSYLLSCKAFSLQWDSGKERYTTAETLYTSHSVTGYGKIKNREIQRLSVLLTVNSQPKPVIIKS